MGRPKLKIDSEQLEIKVLNALVYFNSGWSLSASMSRAGFSANWMSYPEIRNHPRIEKMRQENVLRNYEKRMFKLKV